MRVKPSRSKRITAVFGSSRQRSRRRHRAARLGRSVRGSRRTDVVEDGLGGPQLGDVVARDDQAAHGGIVDQVHDAELEGDRPATAAGEHLDLDGGGAAGPLRCALGPGQRRRQGQAVALDHDVGQRPALDQFLVVAEQAGDGGRDRLDLTGRAEEHDDAGRVVDERPEAADLVVGHFPAPSFGQVAEAQDESGHGGVAEQVGPHHLHQLPAPVGVGPAIRAASRPPCPGCW